MKTYLNKLTSLLSVLLLAGVLLAGGCRDITPSGYSLSLPDLPEHWLTLLGEPNWRIEWVDPEGQRQMMDLVHGASCREIEIPITWANPVMAWPYWPEHNLIPGFFRPAGAIFPFDADSKKINLSLTWEAGVDAVFYWELAHASNEVNSKFPANFNWPRFRELFTSDILNEAVSKDPWLVNWRTEAEKTIANNFNRRRLVPEKTVSKEIPVPEGSWYGTSPFTQPLFFARETIPVFPVRPGNNVWISAEGILRVNGETWIFIEWE